jgi:hypothetical protein
MSYFKEFNFVRAITVLSVLGAIALGYFDWKQMKELRALRAALTTNGEVERLSQETQTLAKQFTVLDRERQGDQFLLALANPDQYIRGMADKCSIGQVKIDRNSQGARNVKGVTDHTFRVTPQDSAQAKSGPYSRRVLSQFFTRLEGDSQLIRITSLKITNAQPKLQPHEIPEDRWTFDCTLTSRQKDEVAAAEPTATGASN